RRASAGGSGSRPSGRARSSPVASASQLAWPISPPSLSGRVVSTHCQHPLSASVCQHESASLERPVTADERVGRRVVIERGLLCARQLGNDLDREDLPELHSPLVERADAP